MADQIPHTNDYIDDSVRTTGVTSKEATVRDCENYWLKTKRFHRTLVSSRRNSCPPNNHIKGIQILRREESIGKAVFARKLLRAIVDRQNEHNDTTWVFVDGLLWITYDLQETSGYDWLRRPCRDSGLTWLDTRCADFHETKFRELRKRPSRRLAIL